MKFSWIKIAKTPAVAIGKIYSSIRVNRIAFNRRSILSVINVAQNRVFVVQGNQFIEAHCVSGFRRNYRRIGRTVGTIGETATGRVTGVGNIDGGAQTF